MRPYSIDLRERVAAAVDDGRWSRRQIARLFRVSVSFVTRLLERRRFRSEVGQIEPGRLQFVDESGANTAMARAYAWSPRGERATGSAPGKWDSFTVIASLGLDGAHAPLVIPGSLDATAFETYVT